MNDVSFLTDMFIIPEEIYKLLIDHLDGVVITGKEVRYVYVNSS